MHDIPLQKLIDRILCAEAHEFPGILNAVTERYSEVFPDLELLTFSVPGSNPEKQIEILQSAIRILSSIQK